MAAKRTTHGPAAASHMRRWREAVYLRDSHECVARGRTIPCAGGLTLQHRQGRGMGGSSRADGPEHYVTLCLQHNLLAERSASFRALAEQNGWSVPRWRNPLRLGLVPVRYPEGTWWLLDEHGDRRSVGDPAPYWEALEADQ